MTGKKPTRQDDEATVELPFQPPSPAEILMRLNLAASTFRKGGSSKAEAAHELQMYLEDLRGALTGLDGGTHTRLLETLRPKGMLYEFSRQLESPATEYAIDETLAALEGVLDRA